jgi:hypothetical protein
VSWTYTKDPSKSDKDWIRWRLADTDENSQLFSDQEIQAALDAESDRNAALLTTAKALYAKYIRKVDSRMGELEFDYSQRAKEIRLLIEQLEKDILIRSVAAPWAASVSKGEKENIESDSDRVEPYFERDMHDFPETLS